MANPNIVGVSTLTGKTDTFSLADTSANVILSNAASSGKVMKVNTIIVANDDGTNAADITVSLNSAAAGGGTAVQIASTIQVTADSTLVLIDKASSFYLLEDKSLVATASAANDLNVIISYEEIS
jgi:predicted butyrate kinase (DUF1464 family)